MSTAARTLRDRAQAQQDALGATMELRRLDELLVEHGLRGDVDEPGDFVRRVETALDRLSRAVNLLREVASATPEHVASGRYRVIHLDCEALHMIRELLAEVES